MLTISLLLALAASPTPDTTKTPAENARDSFAAGQKLYKQARYADAAAKFEEAYLARPHPIIQFNLGRCHEQLNDLPRALRSYKDYLRQMPDAKDKEAVSESIHGIERRLQDKGVQQVLVFAEPVDALISVDGKPLGPSPASIELPPGSHEVSVTAANHESEQRGFVLSASRSLDLSFTLKAMTVMTGSDAPIQPVVLPSDLPPPPMVSVGADEAAQRPRVATWVVGGLAVVAAGTSAGLYGGALGQAAELKQMERPGTVQQQYVTRVESLQTGSVVAAGIAGAAALTTVVLFFLEGR